MQGGSGDRRGQQVSLRGASVKEISRDALLEKVAYEREQRSYAKRAAAAALTIQRIWRGHHSMIVAAEKIRTMWDAHMLQMKDACMTAEQLSNDLIRPFLFFICRMPLALGNTYVRDDNLCIQMCHRKVLQSINYPDPKYNYCSLAFGSAEQHARWFFQTCKMISICASVLSKSASDLTIALSVRLMVSLTDLNVWGSIQKEFMVGGNSMIWKLCQWLATRHGGLYSSVRDYLLLSAIQPNEIKASKGLDDKFMVIASLMTIILRPLQILLSPEELSCFEMCNVGAKQAAENLCIYIFSIPYLTKRLPAALLPALKYASILSPCLKVVTISKASIFQEMAKFDEMNPSGIPSALWVLASFVNLASVSSECSEYSGQFVSGLDCKDYVVALSCIFDNVKPWIECYQHPRKMIDGEEETSATHCSSGASEADTPSYKKERNHSLESTLLTLLECLKPVQEQWHLYHLISMSEVDGSKHAACSSDGALTLKLELKDVAKLYADLLITFSSLNPFGGPPALLNILAFAQGLLSKLWFWLESELIMNQNRFLASRKLPNASNHIIEEHIHTSDGKQETVNKNTNSKWASVLLRVKGKTSNESHSKMPSGHIFLQNSTEKDVSFIEWEVESMKKGVLGLSKDAMIVLYLFCSTYAHLLIVIDDEEFYEKQAPFSLEQQRVIAAVLNTMVYNCYLNNSGHVRSKIMNAAIRCLHCLYERDCRRTFCPPRLWLAPGVKYRPPIAAAARAHEAMSSHVKLGDSSLGGTTGSLITTIPHVFPFEERVQMFREFVKADKTARRMTGDIVGPGPGSIEIAVRRDHIVEDGFAQLNSLGAKLKSCVNVSFVNECGLPEAGLDYGGLFKEFLTDLAKAAFDPRFALFMQTSTDERLLFPHPLAKFLANGMPMIEFLGRIVGKALYEGILLDYSFSHVFVRKLLGRYSFLDELSSLDPELHRNLMYLKHYEGDVRDLALDFTVLEEIFGKRVVIDLRQDGSNIPVTNGNKLQYVYAMADYKLNRQIQPLVNAFNKGLEDLISPSWLSLFNSREFNQLLSGGEHDFDVDDLKSNTRYTGGYSESSRTIKLFWEVVRELQPTERCALLKFVTSCSRAPLLGFKHLQPAFTIHKVACDTPLWAMIGGQDVERLPSASTCYNTLKLPTYKRMGTLKSKLLYAIQANAGFELS